MVKDGKKELRKSRESGMEKKKRSVLSMFLSYYKKEILFTTVISIYTVLGLVSAILKIDWALVTLLIVWVAGVFINDLGIPFIKLFKEWYRQVKLVSCLESEYSGTEENWWLYVLFDVFKGEKIFDLPKHCIEVAFKELFPNSKIECRDVFVVVNYSKKSTLKDRKAELLEWFAEGGMSDVK